MSNRRSPRAKPTTTPVTKIKNPADVVTIVPYLLGFDPEESIVVVALEGSRQRFGPCARLDLLDDHDGDAVRHQVDYVRGLIAHHRFDPVIVVAFSTRADVADAVVEGILGALGTDGVEVVEAVRADGARWWSYLCDDQVCCPSEGTVYDAESSRVAAEAVVAGMARAPSRDALREQFEPQPLQRVAFEESLHALLTGPADLPPWTEESFREAVSAAVSASEPITMDALVPLMVAVQSIPMRDQAWLLMTRDDAVDHFAFWLRALQATPDDLLAPVGSLAAFAAWLSGRGVLASHGAERVLDVHPEYPMAKLVLEVCDSSLNPAVWTFGERGGSPGQPP